MIILTAGDQKFANMIKCSRKMACRCAYPFFAYDLGELGFGEKLELASPVKKTCVHKPGMIRKFLSQSKEDFTVYLDGDAFLVDRIDEVVGDYDIGITVRRDDEWEVSNHFGWLNAGVMFFRPSALPFFDLWQEHTDDLQDDQLGFNRIINPDNQPIPPNQTLVVKGIKIRTFPTHIYNFYYFPDKPEGAKILHFRSINWDIRRHYVPLGVL